MIILFSLFMFFLSKINCFINQQVENIAHTNKTAKIMMNVRAKTKTEIPIQ